MNRKTKKMSDSHTLTGITRINGQEGLVNTETSGALVADVIRYGQVDREEAASLEASCRQNVEAVYGLDNPVVAQESKPFVYKDGAAIIPVHGTLLNRFNSTWGFVTGYNFIRRQMQLAIEDEDVENIILDIDSPGGESAGNFELCREIMAARVEKPIIAIVDSRAASGGYSIASSCTRVYATPSSKIGSIGVYRMHIDQSKSLEQMGIKVTFAKAGEHKTDGNPYEPLSDSALKDWEESAGKTWEDFISVVADGRGISPSEVRNTQARVYRADEALDLGLIDAVRTPAEAIASLFAEPTEDELINEEDNMAEKNKSEVTSSPQASSADIAAVIEQHETTKRQRRTAIRALPEAEGRSALVQALIEETNMSPDECKVVLSASPKESAQAEEPVQSAANSPQDVQSADQANHFDAAMADSAHPNADAGPEKKAEGAEKSDGDIANDILGSLALATGHDYRKKAA